MADCCYEVDQPSGEHWMIHGAPLMMNGAVATRTQSTNTSDPLEPKANAWTRRIQRE